MGVNKNKVRQKLCRLNNLSEKQLQEVFYLEEKDYEFFKEILWPKGPVCLYYGCNNHWNIHKKDRKEPSKKCYDCPKVYT
ncbi:hypothetical protein KHQ81_08465 [Mycoplasmatota bacterium]|nr:hypothetical protein KHQ81_08465 [Mycoplasmatota bacterium]